MRKVKILTITLIIILIAMISFCGIYVKYENRMENKLKDYSYAMDIEGARNIKLKINTNNKTIIKDSNGNTVENSSSLTDEEIEKNGYVKLEVPYNSDEQKNVENYKISKEIIEKRLKNLDVEDYVIKLNEETGEISIEIPENEKTDSIISNISTEGKFEIIDTQTNEVLMDNNDIKEAGVLYGTNSMGNGSYGTSVYLNIEFTKEGKKKLEEISNKYKKETTTDTETETNNSTETENSTENEEEKEEKTITMKIDDEKIITTSFDDTLKTGKIQLSIGNATTDKKELNGYVEQVKNMAISISDGKLPLKYDIDENKYILSDITENDLQVVEYIILGIIVVALIILVIKYKSLGSIGAISYIGLIAVLLLTIRYTNVVVSIEGIMGIIVALVLNYIFIIKLLSKLNKDKQNLKIQDVKNASKENYKEFFIKITPIIIMSIIFSFIKWTPINSFGMVTFWGIVIIAIYNVIITDNLLKIKSNINRR